MKIPAQDRTQCLEGTCEYPLQARPVDTVQLAFTESHFPIYSTKFTRGSNDKESFPGWGGLCSRIKINVPYDNPHVYAITSILQAGSNRWESKVTCPRSSSQWELELQETWGTGQFCPFPQAMTPPQLGSLLSQLISFNSSLAEKKT